MNTTLTTAELFRLLSLCVGKEKEATPYMVSKVMGASYNTVKLWKAGVTVMDENHALQAAEMLGLDPAFVVLSLQAERANKSNMDKIAAIFSRAAVASLGHAAALVFSVFLLLSAVVPTPAKAAGYVFFSPHNLHYASFISASWRAWRRRRSRPVPASWPYNFLVFSGCACR